MKPIRSSVVISAAPLSNVTMMSNAITKTRPSSIYFRVDGCADQETLRVLKLRFFRGRGAGPGGGPDAVAVAEAIAPHIAQNAPASSAPQFEQNRWRVLAAWSTDKFAPQVPQKLLVLEFPQAVQKATTLRPVIPKCYTLLRLTKASTWRVVETRRPGSATRLSEIELAICWNAALRGYG